jgi:hypothetical protein
LFGTDYPSLELLLADGETAEGEVRSAIEELAGRPFVRRVPVPATAFSLPARRNAVAAAARGRVLVMLDAGVDVTEPGWLRELAAQALRPGVGAVGAQLLGPDGRRAHVGFSSLRPDGAECAPSGWLAERAVRNAMAVSGAAMATARAAFAELGGFDAWHYPRDGAEVDFCLRLHEAGYRVLITPFAEMAQHRAAPGGEAARQRALLWRQWRAVPPGQFAAGEAMRALQRDPV